MPYWVSTNTPVRHGYADLERRLRSFSDFAEGRLNIIDFDFYRRVAEEGIPERKVWNFLGGAVEVRSRLGYGARRLDRILRFLGSSSHSQFLDCGGRPVE